MTKDEQIAMALEVLNRYPGSGANIVEKYQWEGFRQNAIAALSQPEPDTNQAQAVDYEQPLPKEIIHKLAAKNACFESESDHSFPELGLRRLAWDIEAHAMCREETRSQLAQREGWKPIESVPKDGNPVLVFLESKMLGSYIHTAIFHSNVTTIGGWWEFDAPKALYWRSLPPSPTQGQPK